MACAWLAAAQGEERPAPPPALRGEVEEARWGEVCELVRSGVASPITTSAGRLFDAAAAICGVRTRVNYEGQAAIEFEAVADPSEAGSYPLPVIDAGSALSAKRDDRGALVLDARVLIRALVADLGGGADVAQVSARFHNSIAAATAEACATQAGGLGIDRVALSGGVFQNRLLLERTAAALRERGLRVLIPERLPPNDGGIACGQVAVAAARLAAAD
jgi:hydrogenase maturation protein HypF